MPSGTYNPVDAQLRAHVTLTVLCNRVVPEIVAKVQFWFDEQPVGGQRRFSFVDGPTTRCPETDRCSARAEHNPQPFCNERGTFDHWGEKVYARAYDSSGVRHEALGLPEGPHLIGPYWRECFAPSSGSWSGYSTSTE